MSKKYDPLKEIHQNIGMVTTEAVGYGIAGKITESIGNDTATKAFSTGSSLAGVPSLVNAGGSVLKSIKKLKW